MIHTGTNNWSKSLPGRSLESRFRIITLLNSRAVGDTIFYHIFAGSVKRLFDHGSLTIYQRADRDYKSDLLAMNREVDQFLVAKPSDEGFEIDSFQIEHDIISNREEMPDYISQDESWISARANRPNLILSPVGMPEELLGAFETPAFLEIPADRVEKLEVELASHGVDPRRWFCVLNYREPGYEHRPAREIKDLNPRPFMELVRYITETLGGQVVRVGHPNMTPFPDRAGFVDLASVKNNFMLHAFAISRARFLIGGLTGISHLGSAMNTPTVMTNCVSAPYWAGCWRDHDLALYLNLYDQNGRRVSTAEQHERKIHASGDLIKLVREKGFKLFPNTANELALAVHELMQATMDCQGWREPRFPEAGPPPNRFEFPMDPRMRNRIVEFPDHARRPA
jgi:putative glycosyltransferase (TIGR04372 family)